MCIISMTVGRLGTNSIYLGCFLQWTAKKSQFFKLILLLKKKVKVQHYLVFVNLIFYIHDPFKFIQEVSGKLNHFQRY